MSDPRRRARELAAEALASGEPTGWFERLYAERAAGVAVVPWDDRVANALLVRWLDAHAARARQGARALDVGCGTGDNAAELARRGFAVTAFDVSRVAVEEARARFAGQGIDFTVADALALPATWSRAFDLVAEVYTLQVLPPEARAQAARAIAGTVAEGGTLVVIARAREPGEPEGTMPWPLLRDEVEAFAGGDLEVVSLEDVLDGEVPPVRRFVATFRRRG